MPLFDLGDHFQIVDGAAPIVVGAPHHGVRPSVDADLGTGPIALALAQRLDARAVIVSDLRRTVDVNKNPLRLGSHVRQYARRYQDELFRSLPRLVIEIHGHVSGQYAVEIATGHELDESAPGDARFWHKLTALKQSLPAALSSTIGQSPTVGVYPIDRDVKKTATDTFTFQKIRRARHLIGAEWYGLHIELIAALRTTKQARSKAFVEALAEALALAIQASFDPLPVPAATIPTHADQTGSTTALIAPRTLSVTLAPEQYAGANVVVVNPIDLEALGARDGDVVVLRHGDEELHSTITPSVAVLVGHAALPARIRRQISLHEHDRVLVGRPVLLSPAAAAAANHAQFVASQARDTRDRCVWLSPAEIARLDLKIDSSIRVQAQPGTDPVNAARIASEASLLPRRAILSRAVMNQLTLTLGEVITIYGDDE